MVYIFQRINVFIDSAPDLDAAEILGDFTLIEHGFTAELAIKQLRGKIKELITGRYRFIFFHLDGNVYVVDAFKKQSKKTPLRIIERAEKIYKMLASQQS